MPLYSFRTFEGPRTLARDPLNYAKLISSPIIIRTAEYRMGPNISAFKSQACQNDALRGDAACYRGRRHLSSPTGLPELGAVKQHT